MNVSGQKTAHGPQTLGHLLSRKFVPIMETLGYILCAFIGAGLIYSLVVKVDIRVPCEGKLEAPETIAKAPADAIVAQWLAQPGQPIRAGLPLCALTTDPRMIHEVRARNQLLAARESLSGQDCDSARAAMAHIQAALESLGEPQDLVTLVAPGSGIVVPSLPALRFELLMRGEAVARLVDVSRLEMKTAAPAAQAAKIALGNPARTLGPVDGAVLEGRISEIDKNAPGKVILLFELLPEALQQNALRQIALSGSGPSLECKAEIIAGKTSLFNSLFGRR